MFLIGSALTRGYKAHTTLLQAYSATDEAEDRLNITPYTQNLDDAAIINSLLQLDIAAYGQRIHNANKGLSILQDFSSAIDSILGHYDEMEQLAGLAETEVYSPEEVALQEAQFIDHANAINQIIDHTTYQSQKPFESEDQILSFFLSNKTSMTLQSRDLRFTEEIDLSTEAKHAVDVIGENKQKAKNYLAQIKEQIESLAQEATLAHYDLAENMGLGMQVENKKMALSIVNAVIDDMLQKSIVRIQAFSNPNPSRLLVVINDNKQPFTPESTKNHWD